MSWVRFYFLPLLLAGQSCLSAQVARQPDRVRGSIDSNVPFELSGTVSTRARPQFDRGAVPPSFVVPDLQLLLKPSARQQADLDRLLVEQQDPASSNYHRWLTPEEFADRFSPSPADINKIAAWLAAEGFQVSYTARARNWIAFSGTAAQVERTFRAPIHRYLVNGEEHFANAAAPSIPAALADLVGTIRGLDDFRLRPHLRRSGLPSRYNDGGGNHFLVPDDLAAIYDLTPLYNAGFNGAGQKLVVVGQTDIDVSYMAAYRTIFNLPAIAPQLVLFGRDPGTSQNDVPEAALDLEVSGAVARNATIIYVYSTGAISSAQYAIDQNLAPVISMSYGGCESQNTSELDSMRTLAQQGASQGISWLAASGDAGAADCDSDTESKATMGKAVDFPGSIPEVTAVGGNEFNEGSGAYWNSTNGPNSGSASGYIPEMAWNDTSLDNALSATGGGVSTHYPTPSWQTGAGFPNDGHRDVPDVALSASADHDGYLVCLQNTNCPPSTWKSLGDGSGYQIYGGTSASTPAFAGILTLVNHYLVANGIQPKPGLGSANPTLYWLAQTSSSAFHDVTAGNNIVPCKAGTTNCSTGSFGFNAGGGYDQATGLGSVDAYKLVTAWGAAVVPQITSVSPVGPISGSSSQTLTVSGSGLQSALTVTLTSPSGTITTGIASSNVSSSSFQVAAALNVSGTWTIQAIDPDGRGSSVFSFGVNAPGTSPAVTVSAAASVTSSMASLSGTVNPNRLDTHVVFVYGTSSSLSGAATTPAVDAGSGSSYVGANTNLSSLISGTTYYYQLWASNNSGTTKSATLSFTTATAQLPATPTGLSPASGASGVSPSLSLNWNQSANAASYTVYLGTANPPTTIVGSGLTATSYSPGLYSGSTTYYWQVVASNSMGSSNSAVSSFTTGALSMPGTKAGVFRNGSSVLEDTNGNGVYDAGTDRFISNFSGPGGYQAGDIGVAGDWNGDGHAKVGIYRSSTGSWYLDANNNGVYDTGDYTYSFGGIAGDIPVVGDWIGIQGVNVHKDCIGVFRSGFLWVLDQNCNGTFDSTPGDAVFPFGGLAGDVPVVGKWTGGLTRVGVVRKYAPGGIPQGQPFFWVVDSVNTNVDPSPATHQPDGPNCFAFGGLAGDIYVVGDWNSTGISRGGIFRSGAAGVQAFEWVLDTNGRHTPDVVFNLYGVAGDQAIVGKW